MSKPTVKYFKDSYINRKYIKSSSERLFFYNKLSETDKIKDLKVLKAEIIDRYGPFDETENLFFITEVSLFFSVLLLKV